MTFRTSDEYLYWPLLEEMDSAEPEQPTADHPTADHPTADHPTADHPTGDYLTADHPTADHPTAEQPTAEEPQSRPRHRSPPSPSPPPDESAAEELPPSPPERPAVAAPVVSRSRSAAVRKRVYTIDSRTVRITPPTGPLIAETAPLPLRRAAVAAVPSTIPSRWRSGRRPASGGSGAGGCPRRLPLRSRLAAAAAAAAAAQDPQLRERRRQQLKTVADRGTAASQRSSEADRPKARPRSR